VFIVKLLLLRNLALGAPIDVSPIKPRAASEGRDVMFGIAKFDDDATNPIEAAGNEGPSLKNFR
jgi:hypothetical protein